MECPVGPEADKTGADSLLVFLFLSRMWEGCSQSKDEQASVLGLVEVGRVRAEIDRSPGPTMHLSSPTVSSRAPSNAYPTSSPRCEISSCEKFGAIKSTFPSSRFPGATGTSCSKLMSLFGSVIKTGRSPARAARVLPTKQGARSFKLVKRQR